MSSLLKILNRLEENIEKGKNIEFRVPAIWNSFGYKGLNETEGIITVNPYEFYSECIKKTIIPHYDKDKDYSKPLSKLIQTRGWKGYIGGDWIKRANVYGMQIRTTSAYDHDASGELELNNKYGLKDTGTFLKTIALLPHLKRMGIDAIYLLPISKNSMRYKKGEMGSPYAVKNFFELDPTLKDPMLGDDITIDEEFKALVEACHILGIRIMIDIIPRTSARDSDLIFEHPEWFYWVKIDELDTYAPPYVEGINAGDKPSIENLPKVYASENVKKHIKKFCSAPNVIDPEKWNSIKEKCLKDSSLDFFELIQEEYGITTAPAFSDCINDPQPPWTDVTFLRLYLDNPEESSKYVDEDQPPYILFDIIKSNLFKGKQKNTELWERIADIIPSYQRKYGIDGARIDMGHALPKELEEMILKNPREFDEDFCFIAEVLDNKGDVAAREAGYNMIIGTAWAAEPRFYKGDFNKLLEEMENLKAPIFAAAETPDTPRAASRLGGKKFSKFVAVMNAFLPNGVPFITSGFEILEKQPMNLGLDAKEENRYLLDKNDPQYGKLAFFDRYALHWENAKNTEIIRILEDVSKLRAEYIDYITDSSNYVKCKLPYDNILSVAYKVQEGILLVLGNMDFEDSIKVNKRELEEALGLDITSINSIYRDFKFVNNTEEDIVLRYGEVAIFVVK
ncbi:alpha-amylase family glycosyl hydrolase [Thermobrachium celere]|uniref:alpha-amylase family glycosyl hydrolase n=1 Tax=Thermobrachium celere TaxID=53422 RepID=UPI001943B229|nr:alpha-amylase family glycosyl hydrolase [Thermobrachium celere]GFR34724.1 maltodextrin glycosyltransferase [Thermobrachium celere]